MIIIEKNARKFCVLKKNIYICNTEKTIKLTIMEKKIKNPMVQNYRITVIFKDEIIKEKFHNPNVAMDTIDMFKKLYPEMFVGGALEEKRKKWEVIRVLK